MSSMWLACASEHCTMCYWTSDNRVEIVERTRPEDHYINGDSVHIMYYPAGLYYEKYLWKCIQAMELCTYWKFKCLDVDILTHPNVGFFSAFSSPTAPGRYSNTRLIQLSCTTGLLPILPFIVWLCSITVCVALASELGLSIYVYLNGAWMELLPFHYSPFHAFRSFSPIALEGH